MRHEAPAAIVRPHADLIACLGRARELIDRAERSALECGRALLDAKELCVRQGRSWYAELAKADINPRTASRYMLLAVSEEEIGQLADEQPADSEESEAAPSKTHPDADPPTPVNRRPNPNDSPPANPREAARREAMAHLDGLGRTLPDLDLLDRHAAELHRLRKDLERAARPG